MVPGKKMASMPQLVVLRKNDRGSRWEQMFLAQTSRFSSWQAAWSFSGGATEVACQEQDAVAASQSHRGREWADDKKKLLRFKRDSNAEPQINV